MKYMEYTFLGLPNGVHVSLTMIVLFRRHILLLCCDCTTTVAGMHKQSLRMLQQTSGIQINIWKSIRVYTYEAFHYAGIKQVKAI